MTSKTWQFCATDSLFFGGGKPMNAGESAWIDSQFPPTGLTLQGAVRTAVLYYTDADINAFVDGKPCLKDGGSLAEEIGNAHCLGQLDLTGPFFYRHGELLLPVPLDLMRKQDEYALLKPAPQATVCDLGAIRLPRLNQGGFKTPENAYISHNDMATLLAGDSPAIHPISLLPTYAHQSDRHAAKTAAEALADKEPKVGLARDNQTRANLDGMLFAIAPIRLRTGVSLRLRVSGIKPEHLPDQPFLQKLGGEGKLARIEVNAAAITMPAPQVSTDANKIRFKLVFTQPALMPVAGWLPEGFQAIKQNGVDVWQGPLNGCTVTLISACIGKPIKLGGWDLQQHQSKGHRAYIPAGSVYFCEAQASDADAIIRLHDTKLGLNTQYGFGHVLVGRW
jgi:CRISPR-associated protein Cmr3